ncbi:hypothetical protein [Sinorhizobium meliloti]|uniref:hypothetical protein n=1 Tax=Rhizobium meliloti TaxID=382 RepID=UPI000FD89D9C|nr:hypothetical protein [Sinorhizobium meliloti]RVQ04171.1 hypothetical protein CN070_03065 [Sinorhizobium meliloti]
MNDKQRIQTLIGTHEGAAAVAVEALSELVVALNDQASAKLDEIEKALIERYKNSEIPPEYEMRHAELVQPILDEISRLIANARAR